MLGAFAIFKQGQHFIQGVLTAKQIPFFREDDIGDDSR